MDAKSFSSLVLISWSPMEDVVVGVPFSSDDDNDEDEDGNMLSICCCRCSCSCLGTTVLYASINQPRVTFVSSGSRSYGGEFLER